MFKRLDLAIINRSFWPIYPVIGEALMRFAEHQSEHQTVGVILQDHADIRKHLEQEKRGTLVKFYPCHAFSVSGSSIFRRIFDAVFFMLWVFVVLLMKRPRKIYVSTDPPVLVPFIVMVYSKIFRASYVYHLQDIHPEAANVVIPVRPMLFKVLRYLDSITMRNAERLITITHEMAVEIKARSMTQAPIFELSNPSVSFDEVSMPESKKKGFTFCGNAGRLQRIPLLIETIERYCDQGGKLSFVFAGAGVYAEKLQQLSERYENVVYKGLISASAAAQLNAEYSWALLPIEDAVTRFAFPSKSSSYVFSGSKIAAVCGQSTSVAAWVTDHKLGVVIEPKVNTLLDFFFAVENDFYDEMAFDMDRRQLKESLSFDVFLSQLSDLVTNQEVQQSA